MPEFLEGTAEVPAVGKVKKAYILIPAGIAAAYVAYRWYSRSREEEPAPGSDGLYTSDDLSEYGLSTTGGSTTVTGNTGSVETDGTRSDAIDDNREWANDAVDRLTNQGYSGQAVQAALGEFLARRALDRNEATIVRAALAVSGQPPEGRPWSVIEEAGTGTGTLPAPTNLRKTATTSTTVSMQWDPVPGALYYKIFRSDFGNEPTGTSVDTKFTQQGLKSNTAYTFTVRAVGTTNRVGGTSNAVTAKTNAARLTRPTGLKASAITRTSFRVSLTPVPGAQFYRWKLDGRSIAPSDGPYRDFTGLRANTTHRVTVQADTNNQSPGPEAALTVRTKR
jgi:hypothetical protein